MSANDRREALLDAAVALIEAHGVDGVAMDTVAEHAGVSRPLVYKHFANRDELLTAVHQREASDVHRRLAREVAAAATVIDMYRTLLHGSLRASAERGPVFAALRAAGAGSRVLRREQRDRDASTVRAFAARAEAELGIERSVARASASMLLSMIDDVLAQWRRRPTPEHAAELERTFVAVVGAALHALAGRGAAHGG